ncbi:MAG TPA: imidazole glycerol phosphate synthase subunit HisH [Chitinophagaceae bacterium]|nr:imidazole glycerol phosphate synthase subunit HisH [Chitinophagaceae bacterium]
MNIAIIKYNAGNIQSVLNALERLGIQAEVTGDADKIKSADKVFFPGVGEAGSAMESLRQNNLDKLINELKQPVLGICVGMQLLCAHSEESNTNCLGIIPVQVKKFPSLVSIPDGEGPGMRIKIPQIGWNTIYDLQTDLFKDVDENSYIYNVHSYYVEDSKYSIAKCNYGLEYAAATKKDNFYGVQFHTEKSAEVGDRIIKNFLEAPIP